MHATVPLPTSDVGLFADDVLNDPYPTLRELREAGPAVRLTTPGSFPATSTRARRRTRPQAQQRDPWPGFTPRHGTHGRTVT